MSTETKKTIEFKHVALLADENITLDSLPVEIRKEINILKPQLGRYNLRPSDELEKSLIKQDLAICDMIIDFVEKDLPPAPKVPTAEELEAERIRLEQEELLKNTPPTPTPEEIEAKRIADETEAARLAEEERIKNLPPPPTADELREQQIAKMIADIMEVINADHEKHIDTDKLASIIGTSPNDPIQDVGNIKLRKAFRRPRYYQI